jgi:hypothetical protein
MEILKELRREPEALIKPEFDEDDLFRQSMGATLKKMPEQQNSLAKINHPFLPATPFESTDFDSFFVGPVNPLDSWLDHFEGILGSDMFQYITEQTNLYAEQNPPGDLYKGTTTCTEEIMLLIGMLLTMGIHRLPALPDYWSKNPILGVQFIS